MDPEERDESASPDMFYVVEEGRLDEDGLYVPANVDPIEVVIEDAVPPDGFQVELVSVNFNVVEAEPPEPEAYIEIPVPQQQEQQAEQIIVVDEPVQSASSRIVSDHDTPRNTKKRKRNTPPKPETPKAPEKVNDDDDDGTICPICLDSWEMSGEHRLTSLKCGHLFGHACIKRWIQECMVGSKCCPSCKTKAALKDFRFLYAKKICVIDNSEELRLRDCLDREKKKCSDLQIQYGVTQMELELQKQICAKLETKLKNLQDTLSSGGGSLSDISNVSMIIEKSGGNFKLFMEKNIEICREPGCRVMCYGGRSNNLMVSQKSTQSLFPGFGVRFIDIPSFKPSSFIHMSGKSVRDLCFDLDEELFISATSDKGAKLFNLNTKSVVNVFTPSEDPIWACNFDVERPKFLYLGTQKGSTYVYDIRHGENYIKEFKMEGDFTPVINISSIPPNNSFPFGGFLVCKLQALWFFEYKSDQTVDSTKLNVEGPFVSMSYDVKTEHILIATRANSNHPTSRYIIANLTKLNGEFTTFNAVHTFTGSRMQPVMSRSTQISVDNNVLVAAYLQDTKMLTTWNTKLGNRKLQSLPVADCIMDMCPIYIDKQVYLGALTDCKCRIYKVCSSN